MDKPKYILAGELQGEGKSLKEIASILNVAKSTAIDFVYKFRHPDKFKLKHNQSNRRYYQRHKEEISSRRKGEWRKHQHRLWRERLTTTIDGYVVTFYHLNKRPRPDLCELCNLQRKRLSYHHWDGNLNKGMWLCGQCHRFVTRVDKGQVEEYKALRDGIERSLS